MRSGLGTASITAGISPAADGQTSLTSPTVGEWSPSLPPGSRVVTGTPLGFLIVLGRKHRVDAPLKVDGLVLAGDGAGDDIPSGDRPVGYGDVLVKLGNSDGRAERSLDLANDAVVASSASLNPRLAFAAPMGGRYFSRPSPNEAPFLQVGQTLQHGQVVAMLEVMKTFNRIIYRGPSLPAVATVIELPLHDGQDVRTGDPLVILEANDH